VPRVVIDEARCKGCALCTIACPRQLIRLSDRLNVLGFLPAVVADGDQPRCTSCALCARMCPDVAISVFRPAAGGAEEGA
jgi:2-oxoglutarate ferredoxin oxidoreductase subunit delta